jgi:signal transduction histidine kinase
MGKPRPLDPKSHLTLYRAVQEGLSNINKHASASNVTIRLDYSDQQIVRLVIKDDGKGADQFEGGFGLMGLRERALLLEGEFNVMSTPGKGFTLEIGVPG